MRRGWTLHEMLVSLGVTGMIVALAASAGVGQLRVFRGIGEVAAVRSQVSQAAMITAAVLRDVPDRSHIIAASDTSIEVAATTGTAITCESDTGRLVLARGTATGNSLGSFAEWPQAGDAAEITAVDSTVGRLAARLATGPATTLCARFPGFEGLAMSLVEPFVVGAGMPVRLTRRIRLSFYRASDGQWYLGLREWNATLGRFNTIQPVAGPLLPYGGASPGLHLAYRDSGGNTLDPPVPARTALVTITVRGDTRGPVRVAGMRSGERHRDSATVSVAVR